RRQIDAGGAAPVPGAQQDGKDKQIAGLKNSVLQSKSSFRLCGMEKHRSKVSVQIVSFSGRAKHNLHRILRSMFQRYTQWKTPLKSCNPKILQFCNSSILRF